MGKLLITAIPSQQTAKAAASQQATPSPTTPEGPAPGVTAVIRFGKNEYRFNVEGISMDDIIDMPCLIPTLENLVVRQRRRPYTSIYELRYAKFPADTEYQIPRYLTFSANGFSTESVVIAGSGRALYNLLYEITAPKKNGIKTLNGVTKLIIHDGDKRNFASGFFNKPGLQLLPNLVIQQNHLSNLITLQLLVALNSKPALDMIANLLSLNYLPQLKTFLLQYSNICCAMLEEKKYILKRNYPEELRDLYNALLTQQPKLDNLRLLLWCEEMNAVGLKVLKNLPFLKTLAIDSVTPTAQLITKVEHSDHTMNVVGGVSNVPRTSYYTETWQKLKFPPNPETSNKPTLISFLREQAEHSLLESLEIFDWPVAAKEPRPDLQTLQTAISQGWLPKLNSIFLRPNAHEFFVQTPSTSRDTWLDTKGLLNAVIEQNLPLINLQLLMPEQNSCIPWLEHLANGGFPTLRMLCLRLPDAFIEPVTLRKESEETYYLRVIHALTLIFNAIVERRVPELESVIFEGDLPEPFTHLVQNIDGALQQMRSQPTALAACYM